MYPQIPPQTPEFENHGCTVPWQQRRTGRDAHCGYMGTKEVTVVTVVDSTRTVRTNGEVVKTVTAEGGATMTRVVASVSVAVNTVSVAVVSVVVEEKVATLLHADEIFSSDRPVKAVGVASAGAASAGARFLKKSRWSTTV